MKIGSSYPLLDRIDGIRIRASVACEEVVHDVAELQPDVLVVFVRPFDDFKPDRIREVQTESPRTGILILSPRTDRQALVHVLNAGVDGHLSIEAGSEELVTAIRAVGRGERRTDPEIADRLFISDRTVQKHIQTAKQKLGLEGPHELRCYLLREGREIGSEYEQA